ncbi:MAG TPA: hypothetical protein VGH28_15520 [Polyangiaceae bacterium]|jgi:hypothetical protein
MKRRGWILAVFLLFGCGDDSSPAPDASTDAPSGDSPSADAGPVVPTVSSWVGTNVAADLTRVDVTYQLAPFDTAANQMDANGYPVAGASGKSSTDIGFVLPSGTYKIAYVGTGTLTVSGIGKLDGAWTQASGENRNTVTITGTPGAFGNFLTLQITNGSGQTVTGVRLLYPGYDYDAPPLFLTQFIALLKPFRALRFMDWEATNGSTIANWSDRPASAHYGKSPNGEPWEHIVELVNETGKDCWVTVPEHADDAYMHSLAQFLRANLDFTRIDSARQAQGFMTPFQVIVEDSNETWNQGFTAYATFAAIAKGNATRYTGKYTGSFGPSWMTGNAALMQVAQVHGDRLVDIGNVFKQDFTDKASVIHPVLSGWALGPGYSDESLTFIAANYGDPKNYVSYVAIAPYFATADDTTTGSLATLFPAMTQNFTSTASTMQDFVKLGAQYGIPIAAYEGGQSLTGTTNLTIKHLAQSDVRMHDTYVQYLQFWKTNFGSSLFMHFSLAGTLGLPENIYQYGFWGSIASTQVDPTTCGDNLPTLIGTEDPKTESSHCPKYRALAEQVP